MLLSVIDESNEYIQKYGFVKSADAKKLITESEQLNFDCLSFISLKTDTVFNQLQMKTILKEINILRQKMTVNQILLDTLETALNLGLSGDYKYLKFEQTTHEI